MQKNTLSKLCLFITLVLLSGMAVANNELSVNPLPKETIFYAAIFDNVCSTKTFYKIDSAWVSDLENHLPHWRNLWNQEGVLLLKTTFNLIGRSFAQQNFQVSLSLCSFPSMSAPLIVNARYALRSFTNQPIPDYLLISNIYHELLHNYIDSFLPKNTSLLTKYKGESPVVINHLHLFALEKAVYLQLGWDNKLKEIIAKDDSLPNGYYKRAWEIVNRKDNYKDFVAELKSYSQSKTLNPNQI